MNVITQLPQEGRMRRIFLLFIIFLVALPLSVYGETAFTTDTGTVTFDVHLDIATKEVWPGDMVSGTAKIRNFGGSPASVNVALTYNILGPEGEMVAEESKMFGLHDVKEEAISVELPDYIGPGMYTFNVVVVYGDMVATSVDTFEVVGELGIMDYLARLGTPMVVVLLLIILSAMLFRRKGGGTRERLKEELGAEIGKKLRQNPPGGGI